MDRSECGSIHRGQCTRARSGPTNPTYFLSSPQHREGNRAHRSKAPPEERRGATYASHEESRPGGLSVIAVAVPSPLGRVTERAGPGLPRSLACDDNTDAAYTKRSRAPGDAHAGDP